MLLSFLTPDMGGKDVTFWFKFLLGIVLFWFLFKLLGAVFGFMAPKAQQFGTTKLVRRLQGLVAETVLYCLLFVGIACTMLSFQWLDQESRGDHKDNPQLVFNDFLANWSTDFRIENFTQPFSDPRALADVALWAAFGWLVLGTPLKTAIAFGYSGIMRFLHKGRFGLGGSARFVGLIEEWRLRWRPRWLTQWMRRKPALRGVVADVPINDSLFMGRSLYNRLLHVALKDDRHMLTIAGSRGGKGISVIIPNLLTFEGSILCIDPKGENAKITARRRREMGQDVFIVDPFHICGEKSDCFNPLAALDPNSRTIREDINVIADALVIHDPTNKSEGSHWEDGARTVLSGLIAQVLTDEKYRFPVDGVRPEAPLLSMIRDLLALKADDQDELWVDMRRNRGAGDAARDAGARMARGIGSEEMQSIISNADKHSEWLSYPTMRELLGKSTFSFKQLKEKPTTIYLVVPPEYLDVHRRFLRLFINLALNEMPKGGRSKIPILMILDEFLQLGRMNQVERAFRLLAGYNFILWPFVQDMGSMRDAYESGMGAFLANSRAVQVFSATDAATLSYVSTEIGERSMQYAAGVNDSLRITPLRTPKEAGLEIERDGGMQYILRAGKPAMILERVKYFEDGGGKDPNQAALYRKLYPFGGLYDKA
jgi:type IV secretion system protein VirD4